MKRLFFILFVLFLSSEAAQLKIVADSFDGDEKSGITVFSGNVKITKGSDELNASTVSIYTNQKRKPVKYVASGDVSFFIRTEGVASYRGKAGKAIFVPAKKEYHLYKDVHLQQLDEQKEINGEEVVISTVEGKARAKGGKSKPVIMTFEIEEEEEK